MISDNSEEDWPQRSRWVMYWQRALLAITLAVSVPATVVGTGVALNTGHPAAIVNVVVVVAVGTYGAWVLVRLARSRRLRVSPSSEAVVDQGLVPLMRELKRAHATQRLYFLSGLIASVPLNVAGQWLWFHLSG